MVDTEFYVPLRTADGECFHATECGAHGLKRDDAANTARHIRWNDLRPCGNCMEHHGLDEMLDALKPFGINVEQWR